MPKAILIITVITTGIITLFAACNNSNPKKVETITAVSKNDMIKRGGYLVTVAGCDDCHSPKKMANGARN